MNVFDNGGWQDAVSGAMHSGGGVRFLHRPYAVVVNAVMYMAYVVGSVVAYNTNEQTFVAIQLPGDFGVIEDAAGTDYRVTRTTSGKLCIAQIQGVRVRIWDREPAGGWVERYSVSIPEMFGVPSTNVMWIRVAPEGGIDFPIWDTQFFCIKLVAVDERARRLFMSFGFDTRVYCINMEAGEVHDLFDSTQHAFMSNIVPVTVAWPPRFPAHL